MESNSGLVQIKHISCEHIEHKDNKRILKLSSNLISKFLICQKASIQKLTWRILNLK
jgi:hypothetical protein